MMGSRPRPDAEGGQSCGISSTAGHPNLTDLFNAQTARRQRSEQIRFIANDFQPRPTIQSGARRPSVDRE